jgi:uncharacterized protein YbbK (DUF523 family)
VSADEELRLGVSSCLLGESVRYDGGHKRDDYVVDTLGARFRLVPVCPEVEMGMSVPREPVQLVRAHGTLRMIGRDSGTDHTDEMNRFARQRANALRKLDLAGYVLKKGSPSCGMQGVQVSTDEGKSSVLGVGLFARALMEAIPLLPVEEEGRLADAVLRENFIVRVFAYHRLQTLFAGHWKVSELVAFHTREELLLTAHAASAYKKLGCIVADTRRLGREAVREQYSVGFMGALAEPAK